MPIKIKELKNKKSIPEQIIQLLKNNPDMAYTSKEIFIDILKKTYVIYYSLIRAMALEPNITIVKHGKTNYYHYEAKK